MCCKAFVFCALLEFTLVNYLWRKPVSQRLQNGARDSLLNGGEALTRSISAGGLVRRATAAASEHHKIGTTTEMMDLASASVETKPIPPAQSNKKVCHFRFIFITTPNYCFLTRDYNWKSIVLILQQRQNRQRLARKIDEWARLGFPVAFALFNVIYWLYYLQ